MSLNSLLEKLEEAYLINDFESNFLSKFFTASARKDKFWTVIHMSQKDALEILNNISNHKTDWMAQQDFDDTAGVFRKYISTLTASSCFDEALDTEGRMKILVIYKYIAYKLQKDMAD